MTGAMRLVPFETAHLARLDMSRSERAALAGQEIGDPGAAFSLIEGERVLGCGGLIPRGPGAEAWVVLSDALRQRPMVLHRLASRILRLQAESWPVAVGACARSDSRTAGKWLERLGFRALGRDGAMTWYQRDPRRERRC